eukprot:14178224-Alexandrium_andersonii.AAC.1
MGNLEEAEYQHNLEAYYQKLSDAHAATRLSEQRDRRQEGAATEPEQPRPSLLQLGLPPTAAAARLHLLN